VAKIAGCQIWANMADGQFEILNLFHGMTGCMRSGVDMLQAHVRRRQTTAFASNCWLEPIPKRITVPSTVHKQSYHGLFRVTNFIQFFRYFIVDGGGLACAGCKTEVVRSPARVRNFFFLYFKSTLGSGGAFPLG